ncbi:MAG TPA: hypothetical protein VGK53_12315, partial [Propionicimonas sp.]
MKRMLSAAALVTASALALTGCAPAPAASQSPSQSASATPQNITLWVAGGDTPKELRDYLATTYKAKTGGTLT